jgi:hypothetical protein
MLGIEQERLDRAIAGRAQVAARCPWIGVFGAPKSASTFVWSALVRLLHAEKLLFNVTHPRDPGRQILHELAPMALQARALDERPVVFRLHVTASANTLVYVKEFSIRGVVCTRSVLDCMVSLREEWVRQWSNQVYLEQALTPWGGVESFIGRIPIAQIRHFLSLDPPHQIDMIVELATVWYLRFNASWHAAIITAPDIFTLVRHEDFSGQEPAVLARLLQHLGQPRAMTEIESTVAALKEAPEEANLNVGKIGRGKMLMTNDQIERVGKIASAVGLAEFIAGISPI